MSETCYAGLDERLLREIEQRMIEDIQSSPEARANYERHESDDEGVRLLVRIALLRADAPSLLKQGDALENAVQRN